MPHNKDQHFNPQFYLRNFATDENGRSIHLYNIARDRSIFGASIAGQCSRPYFYGKDGRSESGLAMLEDAAAPMFRRMITERKLPPRHSPEHGPLGQFIAVQHGRTQARETEINEMADKFGKHVLRKHVEPDLAEYLDNVRISITNAATWNVHVAAVRAPVLFDLEYQLLVAPPGSFYMAGDNPVVFLNQYIDRGDQRHVRAVATATALGSRGFASRGLQISFPISPQLALFLYDRDIYKVGPVGRGAIDISKEDVDHLNALQYINSHNNVYFAGDGQAEYVKRLARSREHQRQAAFGKFEVFKPERHGDRWMQLIVIGTSDPTFVPHLAFSKVKRRVDKTPTPGVRDPVIVQIVKDFSDEMDRRGSRWSLVPFWYSILCRGPSGRSNEFFLLFWPRRVIRAGKGQLRPSWIVRLADAFRRTRSIEQGRLWGKTRHCGRSPRATVTGRHEPRGLPEPKGSFGGKTGRFVPRRVMTPSGSGAVKLIGFHRILGCVLNHNHQMTMGRGRHPR